GDEKRAEALHVRFDWADAKGRRGNPSTELAYAPANLFRGSGVPDPSCSTAVWRISCCPLLANGLWYCTMAMAGPFVRARWVSACDQVGLVELACEPVAGCALLLQEACLFRAMPAPTASWTLSVWLRMSASIVADICFFLVRHLDALPRWNVGAWSWCATISRSYYRLCICFRSWPVVALWNAISVN